MTEKRPRTLPERKRTDSKENKVNIIGVDESAHTIYAQVNGCRITAVCREKADPEIYDRVKGILLSGQGNTAQHRLGTAEKAARKFDMM